MEHYKEGQYDDDLTVGIDEYDEDFDTGNIDLFDYVGDDESPLSRLKSLVLSIDWEITDDILRQFNEELLDLKDIWHNNKVNLIYVQALEKISRYIYKEKASAHPNAIKLLLTFYTNLEKIVSDDLMPDQDKKAILLEDIDRFEKFKKQIAPSAASKTVQPEPAPLATKKTEDTSTTEVVSEAIKMPTVDDELEDMKIGEAGTADPLLNLKAIVYGIDWEITERDLLNLGREVKLLEEEFKTSKAKQIFLQGIGSLGAYINLKRSDSHADAFKLLHSFFTGLETVVRRNLTGQAEKDILLPEVEKFNAFKATVANTLSTDSASKAVVDEDVQSDEFSDSEIQPAFSDVPSDVSGFKEEDEIAALEKKEEEKEDSVDVYFDDDDELHDADEDQLAEEMESRLSGMFEEPEKVVTKNLDANVALQGVDVETEADDESEEEPLPEEDGELSPALAAEEPPFEDQGSPAQLAEKVDDFFGDSEEEEIEQKAAAIPGVDVEHEADDDTDEDPLLFEDGEFAPALSSDDDIIEEDIAADDDVAVDSDIDGRLDNFFGEDEDQVEAADNQKIDEDSGSFETTVASESDVEEKFTDFFGEDTEEVVSADSEIALQGTEVEHEADDDSEEEPLPYEDGELSPALSADDEELEEEVPKEKEDDLESAVEEGFDNLFGDEETSTGEDEYAFDENKSDVIDNAVIDSKETDLDTEDDFESDVAKFDVPVDDGRESEIESYLTDADGPLAGVDVETEDDDDTAEEPLPFEDGELAPALSVDDEIDVESDIAEEDAEESAVADRFDTLFANEEDDAEELFKDDSENLEDIADDFVSEAEDDAFFDTLEEDDTDTLSETVEEETSDTLFDTIDDESLIDQDQDRETAFSQAGFEEISDEDFDDIPEEAIAPFSTEDTDPELDAFAQYEDENVVASDDLQDDEEELLALLGDEEEAETPAFAEIEKEIEEDDEFIPEISSDDLDSILMDGSGVTAAGEIPSGYPSEDELLSEFGDIAGEVATDTFHPEGNEDFIVGVIDDADSMQEEEVVFEAVEDDDSVSGLDSLGEDSGEEDTADYSVNLDENETFGTTLLAEERVNEEFSAAVDQQETDFDLDNEIGGEHHSESLKPESSAYIVPPADAEDNLSGLRNCIVSLGLEIDDTIINSLNEEITKLRHNWLERPAEKTFVQLLATIADHIDSYRYEADPQSNKLLLSVFDKLELCALGQIESSQVQEALLNETSKVLQWQQSLINRTQKDGKKVDEHKDKELIDASLTQPDLLGESGDVKDINIALDDMSKQVDQIGNDLLMEKVSSIMKSEMEQLKSAFQAELKELKNEIMKGKS